MLRLLGVDTFYNNACTNEELSRIASAQHRIILSRNPAYGRQPSLQALIIESEVPEEQLLQVYQKFRIVKGAMPFTRCLRCNGNLCVAEKETVKDGLPQNTALHYHAFWQCSGCEKIYWKGPHYARMLNTVKRLGIDVTI